MISSWVGEPESRRLDVGACTSQPLMKAAFFIELEATSLDSKKKLSLQTSELWTVALGDLCWETGVLVEGGP